MDYSSIEQNVGKIFYKEVQKKKINVTKEVV